MPSDRYVFHFLEAVKAIHRRLLADVDVLDITAWILRTPMPVKEINQKYLAKFKDLLVPEEGEDESEEDEDDEGEEAEDKKDEEDEDSDVARPLPTEDYISYFDAVPGLGSGIRVLVQVPTEAGATSCCAISATRCSRQPKASTPMIW